MLERHPAFRIRLVYVRPGVYQQLCQLHCLRHIVLRAREQDVKRGFVFAVRARQFRALGDEKPNNIISVLG